MAKPLPPATLKPDQLKKTPPVKPTGIFLGDNVTWNPANLRNGHIVIVGTSGSGKTQTLKAIAYELSKVYPSIRLLIIDYHGDLELPGEICYPLNMESLYGINPLTLDLDTKGGGPSLQTIAIAAILKKSLLMGTNQEGLTIKILTYCYQMRGIIPDDPKTWTREPPTFADLCLEIEARIVAGCKESEKLMLKMAAVFEYGIFTRPQPPLNLPIVRFDLSALAKVPGLSAIATESLIKQLLDSHRILGEIESKIPRTYLFIDEAKEVKNSQSLKLIVSDGRKYGLNAVVASQSDKEISDQVIANSSSKIVLPVDHTEIVRVAKRFRFAESVVASLQSLEALVRMDNDAYKTKIQPFYQRI